MSKIRELEAVLGSGARSNKYRVIFPYFGRELDIQTHDVTAPGRSLGIVEVYLKGRKYQLAGDRADEGVITLTFYNDPDMIIRKFFLQVIAGVQNFNVPNTVEGGVPQGGEFVGRLGQQALVAFDEIRSNFRSVTDLLRGMSYRPQPGSHSGPWYQSDIRVQQLNHNKDVSTEAVYHSAFVTDVSAIDYQDEVGEVSTTTITIAYTGVSYDNDSVDVQTLNR